MKRAAFVLAAALLSACGGSNPSSPGPVAPSANPAPAPAPAFRDGWTEQPVGAEAAPPAPQLGTLTTVRASGYLTREAWFRGDPFYLWPQAPDYVQALVYNEWMPGRRLSRWKKEGLTIGATAEIMAHDEARGLIEDAIAELASAVPMSIRHGSPADVRFEIVPENPWYADGRVGTAFIDFRGNEITGARIIFRDIDGLVGKWGRRGRYGHPPLHELGHVLGLGHAGGEAEVMGVVNGFRTDARSFSERERVALKVMYRWRLPGNVFPDSALLTDSASVGRHTAVIVD